MGFFSKLLGTHQISENIASMKEDLYKEVRFRKSFAFYSIQWSLPNACIWHFTSNNKAFFWPTKGTYSDFSSYDFSEFFVYVVFPIVLLFSFTLNDTTQEILKTSLKKYKKAGTFLFFGLLTHQWAYAVMALIQMLT